MDGHTDTCSGRQDHVHTYVPFNNNFYGKITVFKTMLQHKQDHEYITYLYYYCNNLNTSAKHNKSAEMTKICSSLTTTGFSNSLSSGAIFQQSFQHYMMVTL